MSKIFGFLTGKRTFLLALGVAVATWARQHLALDEEMYNWILPLLGAGGAVTLRLAIANAVKEIANLIANKDA